MGKGLSRLAPLAEQDSLAKVSRPNYSRSLDLRPAQHETVLSESVFHSMLTLERRRAERSRKPFVLTLLDANLENGAAEQILSQGVNVVLGIKRETDLVGWYKESHIVGAIFTEVNLDGEIPITETLRKKVENALLKHLGSDKAAKITISMHVFPENWDGTHGEWGGDSRLSSDRSKKDGRRRFPMIVR